MRGSKGKKAETIGIQTIFALSPQAKGRIERLFGTLQNRLEAELNFAGLATLWGARLLAGLYEDL